jgi:hypothetical protein
LRALIADVVDPAIDRPRRHAFWREGVERHIFARQPRIVVLGVEDHRHPVVDLAGQLVRLGRDDRAGFEWLALALRPRPPFPQSGEGERLAAIDFVEEGLLILAFTQPFVVAVGQNQAAPLLVGLRNAGFVATVSARALIVL